MSHVLQYLPFFQNFLEERGFEKMKNGRSSGGLLVMKRGGVSVYSVTPVNMYQPDVKRYYPQPFRRHE